MYNYRQEAVSIIKLGTPVLIAQLAQTGMGFVDTVMAGGVSPTDMAAVAVASSIWFPTVLFGIGVLMAMVPIISQLSGSGRVEKIPFQLHQGIYLSLMIALPMMLLLANTDALILYMDIDPAMTEKIIGYMHAVLWGAPAVLLFQVLRNLCEGVSMTIPAMIIGFAGLIVNIPLNWIFVYGKFGAPMLGGVGCGVATALVYWLMAAAMLVYILKNRRLNKLNLFSHFSRIDFSAQKRIFKLGLPVAGSLFFEVTMFSMVALLIAPLGADVVAAHQVAINFSSLVFMLPLSLATAVSIRVGHQLGEKSTFGAGASAKLGIYIGLFASVITAFLTVVFREQIIDLYTDNHDVAAIAAWLLILAAVYQCTDAIQVVAAGALRGYKDTRAIFYLTLIAYWFVGVPVGYILGITDIFTDPMGATGFWIGLIIGLSVAAVLLGIRLIWIRRQPTDFQLAMAER
ncbi:MATE family efflux transporter [Veronia pacifica]|uniref:MATE family efflux transporter n=1 Tax=Veronia pacifica TaxID=1080227 RepID=UPI0036275C8B